MIRVITSATLALFVIAGTAGLAAAETENDNDRSTYDTKQFFEKLEKERGNGT